MQQIKLTQLPLTSQHTTSHNFATVARMLVQVYKMRNFVLVVSYLSDEAKSMPVSFSSVFAKSTEPLRFDSVYQIP